ncbi:MAG: CPBP family intramembrane metalloprotease [Candidatus Dadabacteria bacterium]|nr:CPBP family intramembrane metalloprotease [Candidatus Dadabacteria bacterium]NIQ16999.1 CPBP family intramembrane metalloprotease [Candidatus Dadabacteria bacterium]
MKINFENKLAVPILTYVLLILIILLTKNFLSYNYIISLTATFMLLVPIILNEDENLFKIDYYWFKKSVIWTVAIIGIYLVAAYFILSFFGKNLSFSKIGISLVFVHLFLVAIPEEVFFRGYLQRKFGNTYLSIAIVSILFALAHFITICVFGNHSLYSCSQSILTFFPSLLMGYLYFKTGTIWSSVFFHFIANLAHISMVIN